jgi:hypothetical protein
LANSTRALSGSTMTTEAGRASSSSRGQVDADAVAAETDSPLTQGSLFPSLGAYARPSASYSRR